MYEYIIWWAQEIYTFIYWTSANIETQWWQYVVGSIALIWQWFP
jgi:hypothetical protein